MDALISTAISRLHNNPPWEHVVSISGGKDSAATALVAMERRDRKGREFSCVMADTGNEHDLTYEFRARLEKHIGIPIPLIKADFTFQIERKRRFIERHWHKRLTMDHPGRWGLAPEFWPDDWDDDDDNEVPDLVFDRRPEAPPSDPYTTVRNGSWVWQPAQRGMSDGEAARFIARVLEVLHPTGNPFLDLCLWKTRFPSAKARFCTEELKVEPIIQQVYRPLWEQGKRIISWQGVRADESLARSQLEPFQRLGGEGRLFAFRPMLRHTREDVCAIHRRHGLEPNKLYSLGMGRVGCMPCIMCRKGELRAIAKRFPDHIDRIALWEEIVTEVSKRGCATFFPVIDDPLYQLDVASGHDVDVQKHGIHARVEWSKTSHGGRQYDMLLDAADAFGTSCDTWGACE
jgi:3'-phosphoadenosine 5'-phosphosulfate sulfotransferase (PAPS reductase)/FAD synthetase